MKSKYYLPNDLRDFLSLISFLGFIGIFLSFVFNITWITDNLTAIFLVFGGAGLLIVGKVVTIRKWLKNGVQENEVAQLASLIFGLSAFIIGILFLFNITIPERILGYIGLVALVPAFFILIDYIVDNK